MLSNLDYIQLSVSTAKYIIIILLLRNTIYKYLPKYTMSILWYIFVARLIFPFTFEYKTPNFIKKFVILNEQTTQTIYSLNPSRDIYLYIDAFIPRFFRYMIILIIIIYFVYLGIKQIVEMNLSNKLDMDLISNKKIRNWLEEKNKKFIFRKIEIYTNKKVVYPVTYGVFRPKIVLPVSLIEDDDILLILEHEFTHIKRWDILYTYIVNLTFCIHFFNPIVWLMCSKIQEDIEILCDDTTIKRIGENKLVDYMKMMIKLYLGEHLKHNKNVSVSLNMSSTKERMLLMKVNNKLNLRSMIAISLLIALSLTSFLSPIVKENIKLINIRKELEISRKIDNINSIYK